MTLKHALEHTSGKKMWQMKKRDLQMQVAVWLSTCFFWHNRLVNIINLIDVYYN